MIIEKNIEVKLDIENETEFCQDFENNIKKQLEEIYIGRCYNNILILQIKNILLHSDVMVQGTGARVYGSINITFTVSGIVYNYREGIVDATIIKKSNSTLLAENKYCKIFVQLTLVNNQNVLEGLKEKQMIPVRTLDCRYDIKSPVISVFAELYKPKTTTEYYDLSPFKPGDTTAYILKQISQTEAEYKELEAKNTQRCNFYINIYYAYVNQKKYEGVDLLDLAKGEYTGPVKHSPQIRLNERMIEKSEPIQSEFLKTKQNSELVVNQLLINYMNNLRFLIDLMTNFNEEKDKESSNLWRILFSFKLDRNTVKR